MIPYRCYFLDGRNRICGSHDIMASSDIAAFSQALTALSYQGAHLKTVEVWQGIRKIEGSSSQAA